MNLENVHYPYYANSLEYNLYDEDSYKYFWKAIDRELGKSRQVYVSPDGIYHKINPNQFRIDSKSFVIDEYYVSYLTNCTDLLKSTNTDQTLNRIYLFGNPTFNKKEYPRYIKPLPGAQREVIAIDKYFEHLNNWESKIYIEDDASESRLRSVYKPRVLHIATHGFFMEENRIVYSMLKENTSSLFKSGLYLSGIEDSFINYEKGYRNDPSNDGILTAYEAMNMDLDGTDVVILSACETGLGDITNGEGVYGLQRSFIVAGAKSVILSLVKVDDDATEKLMNYFYESYTKNFDIKSALFQAQMKIKLEYPNPYIWGSFILIGKG